MTWQPWEDFKTTEIAYELPIEAPPCAKCRFWAPRRKYEIMDKRGGTAFTGVILCHAASMYPDFSCFKEIPGPETVENERR